MPTKIEWCDETINPMVGCTKCSPGCDNCYAEKMAFRLSKMPHTAAKYAGVVDGDGHWTGKMSRLDLSVFDRLPKNPRSVFVGSMTDIFHESYCDDQMMRALFSVPYDVEKHKYLFLTKRPENMKTTVEWLISQDGDLEENIWLGATVCNQKEAEENIPIIQQIPTVRTFISIEPMLGPIDLAKACPSHIMPPKCVIVGGETGTYARPMHPDWVRSIRDQCAAAGVPFFFKGWGKYKPCREGIENCAIISGSSD